MNKIIPNSYQTPNYYADVLMEHLTAEEWKVLSYAMRRIFGFNKRKANISISMFTKGFSTREGEHHSGTGLGNSAVLRAIEVLETAGIMIKVSENDPKLNHGAAYTLQLDDTKINLNWLLERTQKRVLSDKSRTEKARSVRQNGGTIVGQNGGTIVGQKHKTQETQETHMAQAPKNSIPPMPLDWQIAGNVEKIEMPTQDQEWQAKRDIAVMQVCVGGLDLEQLARAFIDARKILPTKREAKTWGSALREMHKAGIKPEHVTRAVDKLTRAGMTIADPYAVLKTARDLSTKQESAYDLVY